MSGKTEFVAETIATSASSKAVQAGAATGALGFLTQINWIGASGVIIAVLGLVVNFYFQARRDRREARESAARIKAMAAGAKL